MLKRQEGQVGVPVIILIVSVLMVILVVSIVPVMGVLTNNVAKTNLEGSGYIVLANGEYVSIDSLLDAIKAKTDNLPVDPADQSLLTDNANTILSAIEGIDLDTGDVESDVEAVEEELEEFELHFHGREIWFGISADQSGNNWALQETLSPFRATSGNNAWGTEGTDPAKVIGTDDWADVGSPSYGDAHRLLIVANTSNTVYKVRIIWDLVSAAAGTSAGRYSEIMFIRDAVASQRKVQEVMMPKIANGYKVWIEVWNATNDATLDFFVGCHVYP